MTSQVHDLLCLLMEMEMEMETRTTPMVGREGDGTGWRELCRCSLRSSGMVWKKGERVCVCECVWEGRQKRTETRDDGRKGVWYYGYWSFRVLSQVMLGRLSGGWLRWRKRWWMVMVVVVTAVAWVLYKPFVSQPPPVHSAVHCWTRSK